MDPQTQAWIDQYDAHITAIIRRHGWFIQYIGGDSCSRPGCPCTGDEGPPFAYTVGLFGLNHPELLIFDIAPQTVATMLNVLGDRVRGGRVVTARDDYRTGRLESEDRHRARAESR